MVTVSDYIIENAVFMHTNNICINISTYELSISITTSIFTHCQLPWEQNYTKGGILFMNVKQGHLHINKCCSYKGQGYEGSFLYADLLDHSTQINQTSTNEFRTKSRAIFFIRQSHHVTRDYNSSNTESLIHGNIILEICQSIDLSYMNYYNNRDDVLIHAGTLRTNTSFIRDSNFISNTILQLNIYGIIFTNNIKEQILVIRDSYFKDNTHFLFCPKAGTFHLYNVYYDGDNIINPSYTNGVKVNQEITTIPSISLDIDKIQEEKCESIYNNKQKIVYTNLQRASYHQIIHPTLFSIFIFNK